MRYLFIIKDNKIISATEYTADLPRIYTTQKQEIKTYTVIAYIDCGKIIHNEIIIGTIDIGTLLNISGYIENFIQHGVLELKIIIKADSSKKYGNKHLNNIFIRFSFKHKSGNERIKDLKLFDFFIPDCSGRWFLDPWKTYRIGIGETEYNTIIELRKKIGMPDPEPEVPVKSTICDSRWAKCFPSTITSLDTSSGTSSGTSLDTSLDTSLNTLDTSFASLDTSA